jgi:hypothetical protein
MPLGFLKNQPGDVEQRISATRHLDLAGQRFDTRFIRDESEVYLRQRERQFRALITAVVAARTALVAIEWTLAATFTAWSSARPPAISARWTRLAAGPALTAKTGTVTATGRAGALAGPAWAITPAAISTLFPGFVIGKLFRRGWLLRPRGEKKLFQIQFVFR